MQSVLDIFKIGIGPSSSHTMGPMVAARRFLVELGERDDGRATRIEVELHGSLALTGKGHMTDRAVILGLAGIAPETADMDEAERLAEAVARDGRLPGGRAIAISFVPEPLPLHENGMVFRTVDDRGEIVWSGTWYSVGGGRVVDEGRFGASDGTSGDVPYPYASAEELLSLCAEHGLSLSTLVWRNEEALRPGTDIVAWSDGIWSVMRACMERGMRTEGLLPGGLRVVRRAPSLLRMLEASAPLSTDPMKIVDWVGLFAMAVSEENAAGGRMVTAPTSGACGVVPAVLEHHDRFVRRVSPEARARYLLTCGAIGMLYATNASISGAEVGCQGEVGVACSMAAAGLTELMGRGPRYVASAAEIAMEHCLGMTCDPIAGLVQIPCIERNAVAAVKAINASRMAMARDTPPLIGLDDVIATMYQTGKDLSAKYRETAEGGLAKTARCG